MATNARFIITGDKGLLSAKQHRGIKILTPEDFLKNKLPRYGSTGLPKTGKCPYVPIISSVKRNLKEALNPQIKSLNFLNNILAKIEAKKKNAYEALMLNSQSHLTEGTICNVFFVLKKKNKAVLCTPSLDCGILDGITRNIVLELAQKSGIKTKEGKFKKKDIYRASEVFITNTTMEIMPVCKVDSINYRAGTITKLLHEAYKENVRAYLAKSD